MNEIATIADPRCMTTHRQVDAVLGSTCILKTPGLWDICTVFTTMIPKFSEMFQRFSNKVSKFYVD